MTIQKLIVKVLFSLMCIFYRIKTKTFPIITRNMLVLEFAISNILNFYLFELLGLIWFDSDTIKVSDLKKLK